jgi:O-antigen ligase/Tfp pilus assembly protein PilF
MHSEGLAGQVARWTAIGALFLLPLVPLFVANGLFFPFITGKAFAFRILVEIACAAWVVLACLDKRYRPQFSWLGALFVVFVAWMFVADCLAINPGKALWSNFERMEGWVTLIHLLALFLVASSVLTVGKLWRAFWLTTLGVSFIVCLYGLLQIIGVATIHQGGARLDASFGNATYLAVYFLFHIFIAGWLTVGEIKERTWLRFALPLLIVLETVLMIETATRGAVLGVVIGALIAGFLAAVLSGGKARTWGAGAAVLLLLVAGGFFLARNTSFVQHDSTLQRISSISLDQGATRFTLWHMAYEGTLVHPVFGWGQEGYNYVFNQFYEASLYGQESWFDRAHNSFIDWLVAGGLPAFLIYISLFLASFWLLFKRPEFSTAEKIGISTLLIAYAVHSLFVFDNLISSLLFVFVIAYIHQRSSRPIAYFENLGELAEDTASTVALPVATVVLLVVLWFVNVPGISTATELITALSPSADGPAGQLATFKDVLSHPAFGAQEAREQLVSFATQSVGSSNVRDTDKAAIVSYTLTQMQEQVAELPRDARLRLELSIAYRLAGDDANALKQDIAAEQLSPQKEDIYNQEGMTRWEAGDFAGAKAAFDKAFALAPESSDLAVYAAIGDVITGDSAGANAILQKAFGTTTVDNQTLMLAYYRTKDWPALIASLTQYVADQKGSSESWFRLAAGYVNAGDLADARKAVESGIAAHPEAAQEGQTLLGQLQAMQTQK